MENVTNFTAPGPQIIRNKDDSPKACMATFMAILAQDQMWAGVLGFDELAQRVMKRKPPPYKGGQAGPWTDADEALTVAWLNRQYEIDATTSKVHEAARAVAHNRLFHPVREYLAELKWDGIQRVEDWLTMFLGAGDSPYVREVGRKFLVGAVARVREPGCKHDSVLILEGPQGALKSSAVHALFGDEWFTDELIRFNTKDAYQVMAGRWCVEMGELESFKRAESEQAKLFFSKRCDRYRPPYGRNVVDQPRQCVFVGTVNESEYLHDSTGNRRYWPVKVGRVLLDDIRESRDQLWTEADMLYQRGESWWIAGAPEHVTEEQAARQVEDPWEAPIRQWLSETTRRETTMSEILREVLNVPVEQQNRGHQVRAGNIVARSNWERRRKRIHGQLTWVYERPGE